MILGEDIQVQMFRQAAFGVVPGAPSGILIPRGSGFGVEFDQKFIDNPQVFIDGIEREPALGNKVSSASGDVVPNMNWWPELQKDITGMLVTSGAGPYDHLSAGINRQVVPLRLLELGFIPFNLFYRFFDMALAEATIKLAVEGIFTVGTKWTGTGKVSFPPLGASLDATPTELVGETIEFVDTVLLENGVDGGDCTGMEIKIVKSLKEKRVSGKGGEATQIVCGNVRVAVTLDFYFESDARWARARAGTLTSAQATIAAGADQSVLTFPEGKLNPVGPKQEGEDGVMQKFELRSIRKTNFTQTPINILTTNTTATVS
jgi:hypothetical protein